MADRVDTPCTFCRIRDGEVPAHLVLDEPSILAFLDRRPLFAGHVLTVPRIHYPTVVHLPVDLIEPLWTAVGRLAAAVQEAMAADGTLIVINNVVSQSVPHLHVHVVPRKRGDGLRGFLWPRSRYPDDDAMAATAATIRQALGRAARPGRPSEAAGGSVPRDLSHDQHVLPRFSPP